MTYETQCQEKRSNGQPVVKLNKKNLLIEGNACHDTMTSGSSTLEFDTDFDTAMNMLGESVSLTRMGEEKVWLVSSEPFLAVVMEQSPVPGKTQQL